MPDSERVAEPERSAVPLDATMDELEADIQRRLNLIKESLAKIDAPVPADTIKSGKNTNNTRPRHL